MERNNTLSDTEMESIENLIVDFESKKKLKEAELKEVKFVIAILERLYGVPNKTKQKKLDLLKKTKTQLNIPKLVERVLEKHGKLHYEDIYKKMIEDGIAAPLLSVKATLYANSTTTKNRFRRIGSGIFELRK